MPPAEPLEAVQEMTETLNKANVRFWKLKDQMVAAGVPGAKQADWSEDLIVLAVQHNFKYDFTRVGLSRPPPKAAHSGGAAAGAHKVPPPPPLCLHNTFHRKPLLCMHVSICSLFPRSAPR